MTCIMHNIHISHSTKCKCCRKFTFLPLYILVYGTTIEKLPPPWGKCRQLFFCSLDHSKEVLTFYTFNFVVKYVFFSAKIFYFSSPQLCFDVASSGSNQCVCKDPDTWAQTLPSIPLSPHHLLYHYFNRNLHIQSKNRISE